MGLYYAYTQGDVALWLQHIDFCKAMNQHELLGRLYGKALALHPRQAGNIMAAHHNGNMSYITFTL